MRRFLTRTVISWSLVIAGLAYLTLAAAAGVFAR
jgi:hypothetical protein